MLLLKSPKFGVAVSPVGMAIQQAVAKLKARRILNTIKNTKTKEIVNSFSDAIVFFAGPPGKEPDLTKFKAFILPPVTYKNDCI